MTKHASQPAALKDYALDKALMHSFGREEAGSMRMVTTATAWSQVIWRPLNLKKGFSRAKWKHYPAGREGESHVPNRLL